MTKPAEKRIITETNAMKRVPISKLRASLAAYMERLAEGESFIITDRGIPIGKFSPVRLDASDKDLVHLVATGQVEPAEGHITEEFFRRPFACKDPEGLVLKGLLKERGEGR